MPRWARWTVVPLMIVIPVGNAVIAARQSRDSGEHTEKLAAATGLTHAWPTRVQRRIYQVPIPARSRAVSYLETNSWNVSSLYVRFTTTPSGLDRFLGAIHTDRAALIDGDVTITARQARTVGWGFTERPGHHFAGLSLTQHGDKPDHAVTVNLADPAHPAVYVVSTMNFPAL
jgi:hypothetical protein